MLASIKGWEALWHLLGDRLRHHVLDEQDTLLHTTTIPSLCFVRAAEVDTTTSLLIIAGLLHTHSDLMCDEKTVWYPSPIHKIIAAFKERSLLMIDEKEHIIINKTGCHNVEISHSFFLLKHISKLVKDHHRILATDDAAPWLTTDYFMLASTKDWETLWSLLGDRLRHRQLDEQNTLLRMVKAPNYCFVRAAVADKNTLLLIIAGLLRTHPDLMYDDKIVWYATPIHETIAALKERLLLMIHEKEHIRTTKTGYHNVEIFHLLLLKHINELMKDHHSIIATGNAALWLTADYWTVQKQKRYKATVFGSHLLALEHEFLLNTSYAALYSYHRVAVEEIRLIASTYSFLNKMDAFYGVWDSLCKRSRRFHLLGDEAHLRGILRWYS